MDKISFNLDPGEWHLTPGEAVWAERLGPKNLFRINNTPYFVKGISYLDEVIAVFNNTIGSLDFSGIVTKRSGHSTYRLVTAPSDNRFGPIWAELNDLGCSFEALRDIPTSMGIKDLFAVDIPPRADIYDAYKIMQRGQTEGFWRFQEGLVGHRLRDCG